MRAHVACGRGEILRAAAGIRAQVQTQRRAERVARLIEISRNDSPLPSERRYPVLLVDAPYQFIFEESRAAAANHYPCMSIDEIAALPVAELATPDAILFLWAPSVLVFEANRIIEAWGFSYQTMAVWVKDKIGLGCWVRSQHEPILIATRGNMPCPAPANRPPSVIHALRREHSRKPDESYEIIERMYPSLPRIELFARARRPGWDAWGNEVPTMVVTPMLEAAE